MLSRLLVAAICAGALHSECQGDLNQDSALDVLDLSIMVEHIMSDSITDSQLLGLADYNSDENIDILDIMSFVNIILNPELSCLDIIISGITETDASGQLIGEVDDDDWCEFDASSDEYDFGLNPMYPNPVSPGQWGPFGDSYQLCFQYSCPTTDFFQVQINLVSAQRDTIYTLNESYGNGLAGICAYIGTELITEPMYRMTMSSGDFQCHGDIEFLE